MNFDHISYDELAKETWDVLVKYYEGGEKVKGVKLQALRRQYELLHMGDDKKIAGYVSKVHNFVHLMKGYGETITNKMIVNKVICTLTSHFGHIIVVIQESSNLETLKLEDLTGSCEAHELRIVERKGVQDSIQALQAQTWKKHGGSNKFRGKTQSKNSWSNPQKHLVDSESPKRGEGTLTNKEEKKGVRCYNCEKWGHLSKNCWSRKDKGATKGKDDGANIARQDSNDSEDLVFMTAIVDEHIDSNI